MARKKGQISKFFAGILLVLLIIGLAGFGAQNFGGRAQSVGTVGDTEIDINRYARALSNELRNLQQRTGQPITLAQAQQFGVDRTVLQQLIGAAALENETKQLGLSIGDIDLQRQLLATPSFQDSTGAFDRNTYEFTLSSNGLTPNEYESTLRAETAGSILQTAIISGVASPKTYEEVIMGYLAERRDFSWISLDARDLDSPLPEPQDADLQSYFEENPDNYVLPITRKISYAWLSPFSVMDQIDIDEAELRTLYDERSAEYIVPERRLVDQLIYLTMEQATEAAAQLADGSASFDDLVEARGLTLADVDFGVLGFEDFGTGADQVFALTEPGITQPVETDLGPALVRVNALLNGRTTEFETVRDTLRAELVVDLARALVDDQITGLEDLLAGGASLEELTDESDMVFGQIDWVPGQTGGLADFGSFTNAAAQVTPEDFPEITVMEDGGIFALRLDEQLDQRPDTFENARDQVEADWRAAQLLSRLQDKSAALLAQLDTGATLSSLGLPVTVQTRVTRDATITDAPADLLVAVFEMEPGQSTAIDGNGQLFIAQLNQILPPDLADPESEGLRIAINQAATQTLGEDALSAFMRALQTEAGITLNQPAINSVNSQLSGTR